MKINITISDNKEESNITRYNLGEFIHNIFVGNPDYKNSNILLNVDNVEGDTDILIDVGLGDSMDIKRTTEDLKLASNLIMDYFANHGGISILKEDAPYQSSGEVIYTMNDSVVTILYYPTNNALTEFMVGMSANIPGVMFTFMDYAVLQSLHQ